MTTYKTTTLKTVTPQLHHDRIKYCLKTEPLTGVEGNPAWKKAEQLEPETDLIPGDNIVLYEQNLFYIVKFRKR